MEDRHEEIWKQYNMAIRNVYRVRGAYILETNQGLKLYRNYEGSDTKIEFEQSVKEHLQKAGYTNVDLYLRNQNGELITEDSLGTKYVIKSWFNGEECNLRDEKEITAAANNLGNLHRYLNHVEVESEEQKTRYIYNLGVQFDKHNRELKRVRGYIRDKKQKNEFEVCFLNVYNQFYEQGLMAIEILGESAYDKLLTGCVNDMTMCHGNYIYHNIIMLQDQIATTNFEKVCIGVQMLDLYCFIRKVMEKNNWEIRIGNRIIEEYARCKGISDEEFTILYAMLLYPEKFWKVTNFYYNARKSWVPRRNIQKLMNLSDQANGKDAFLLQLR
ncbi:CotS family spore coat protein [Anaerosporobacter faecicola]|uniref:CotS family spore coat protein n=1 Tax=Anaerosporobacter faecicola TaxID=2718714 RepID=UPI001439BEF9|nr:CotS family spore coat protein [Anaerosporobacter faecicola]